MEDRTATVDVVDDLEDPGPRFVAWPMRVMQWIGGITLVVLVIQVMVDVVARNVFNSPIMETIDFVQFWWMPISSFVGVAFAQYVNEHIIVETLLSSLSEKVLRVARRITLGVTAGFCLVLGYFGLLSAIEETSFLAFAGGSKLPIWPPFFIVPIAILTMVVCLVWQIITPPQHDSELDGATIV